MSNIAAELRIFYPNDYFGRFYYHGQDDDGRNFYIDTGQTRSLKTIDRPKPDGHLIAHSSETGWNLSTNHPRHLFELLAGTWDMARSRKLALAIRVEILETLLAVVLTVAEPEGVSPCTILGNWEKS